MNWILDKEKNMINLSLVEFIWIQDRGEDWEKRYELVAEMPSMRFVLSESDSEEKLQKEKLDLYSKLVNNFDSKSLYNVRY